MRRLTGWAAAALLAAFTCYAPRWAAAADDVAGFALKDTPGEHLDVLHDGRVAARYMYAHDTSTPERTHDTYKPYLHVFDADGKLPITKGAGGEFTHHRGIFIGWNKLGHAGKTYDRWHMQTGAIVHQRFADQQAGAGEASFTSVAHWNDDKGKPLLVEERTLSFAAAPAPARLVIGFASKLTNVRDGQITLDGDPEHAGIHYRPADELVRADTVYVYAKENAKPHEDVDYPWVGQTHTLGGEHQGKRYSVVQMSHPANPTGTRWSAYRNYGRFGAFPVATVKPGEPLVLHYRFLIADGEMPPPDFIQESWDTFAGVKEASPAPKVTVLPAEQPKADAGEPGEKPLASAMTKPTTRPKAGHPSNPGPEDPPILFDVPTPEPLTVEQALETFKIQGDFRIEPVAFEPMVEDPIAISFDERGRMYVVEMRGYMHDVEAKGEDQPIGRIRLLEDVDGDGRMDKASVFLDGLVMPRAVLAVRGGALVAEPPELAFWEDTDNDGKADKKTLVATDYGKRGGQPEHMANTPTLAMDNWVYSAGHYARFRFGRGKWAGEFTRSRGQWGLSQDDYGRLFYCYNSDLGRADLLPAQYAGRNPYHPGASFYNAQVVTRQDVWPSHPTPGVNRGYEKGQLREDGTLRTATAAGGNAIYRGGLFPAEFAGNLFVPEPSGNLVKRLVLSESGGSITASDAYEGVDFLTSTDERFRPVQVTTGPDGALYLVDMYRGVLQHHGFLTHYLIKNIKQRDLETPIHMGRIYRIVPAGGAAPRRVTVPREAPALLEYLEHANGWVRDTAQRLLVEINDRKTASPLKKLAREGASPLSRLHALWTLEGMGRLDAPTTLKALADADAKVRAAAVRLCDPLLVPGPFRDDALRALLKLVPAEESPDVRLQLALTLSVVPVPSAQEALGDLLTQLDITTPELMRDAALSGLRGRELEFIGSLLDRPDWSEHQNERAATLTALARCVMAERRPSRVRGLLDVAADEPSGSWRQVALLEGMSPGISPDATDEERKQAIARVKLVYLDEQPESLQALLGSTDSAVRTLGERLDARLAWPGKPGVPPPPKVVPLTPEQQARFERGREVFANTCAACHQPNGQGLEGLAPPLADSEWVTGSPARLVRVVLHGLTGPITVNGARYNLEMPALPTLSDAEVADVLTYVRRDWDHAADPVDEAAVRAVRDQTGGRVALWTAKELQDVK